MSGFFGVVCPDGSAPDPDACERILDALRFRGPDGAALWIEEDGPAALGHTLLADGPLPLPRPQPRTLGGRYRLVADAALDARSDLRADLALPPGEPSDDDADLILHAWLRWGDGCVAFLHGDFAFAIWDTRERRLFCARDRFGVRPFFYGMPAGLFLFGNTLDALRCHPAVSDDLDEEAVAEFLLFSGLRRLDLTIFRDLRRLPPASTLTWSPGSAPRVRRYWRLEVPPHLRTSDAGAVMEAFQEVFGRAVADRLPSGKAAFIMSGGLDSTSVAAQAVQIAAGRPDPPDLKAVTFVYEHLIPDEEDTYARMAADALGIPIDVVAVDAWDSRPSDVIRTPEPFAEPTGARAMVEAMRRSPGYRWVLTGYGGDPALHPGSRHAGRLLRDLLFGRLGRAVLAYRVREGRFPRIGIRATLREAFRIEAPDVRPPLPPWLAPDFAARYALPERWAGAAHPDAVPSSARSSALTFLRAPYWTRQFEDLDAGTTGVAVTMQHPFFDERVIAFLLSLPPVPWCVDKRVLRCGLRGVLPDAVVDRPKSPLRGSPSYQEMLRDDLEDLSDILETPALKAYVDTDIFRRVAANREQLRPWEYELVTRPLGLARWMRRLRSEPEDQGSG